MININGKWLTETVFDNNGKLSIGIKISEDGLTWRSIQNIPNNTTVNSGSTGNKKAITYANGILMPDVSMDGVYSAIEDIFAEGIISAPIPRIVNA